MTVTDVNVVKSAIFERPDDANKGTLGSLLCVCGSYGMAGAAVMSANGALRTGIGLAKCALPRSIYPIVAQTILESVYYPLSENADGRISKVNVPFLVSESCKILCNSCRLRTRCVRRYIKNCIFFNRKFHNTACA